VLTEHEVARSWLRLFQGAVDDSTFRKAEQLLDELRPESPLRHRLQTELDELMAKQQPAKKKTRRAAVKAR
jgi:hypothetical protein